MSTRRDFLKGCASFAATAAARGFGLSGLVFASQLPGSTVRAVAPLRQTEIPPSGRDLMVLVFIRGGLDGLNFVVPHNTSAADVNSYYNVLRPTLGIPAANSSATRRVYDLDGRFGLHPDAARGMGGVSVPNAHASDTGGLGQLYRDGDLAIVHACGSPDITGSHFDTELYVDLGGRYQPQGWMGRYLDTVQEPNSALSVAPQSSVPYSLYSISGRAAYAIPNASNFGPAWRSSNGSSNANYEGLVKPQIALMNDMLARGNPQPAFVELVGSQTMSQYELLRGVLGSSYTPSANYLGDQNTETAYVPDGGQFARALKTVAQLAKASALSTNPLRVAAIDVGGGYDTHDNQGTTDWAGNNRYPRLIANLSNNLKAFRDDMNADVAWRGRFVVMVMSEFGRVLYENKSGGTDHGSGNAMLVMGSGGGTASANINGGQVYADWPGLQRLGYNHGLPLTTDYRRVISEVLNKRMGVSLEQINNGVFPDVSYASGFGIART